MFVYRNSKSVTDLSLDEYQIRTNVASIRHAAYTDDGVGYLVLASVPATLAGSKIVVAQENKAAVAGKSLKALFMSSDQYNFEADTNDDTAPAQRFHRYNLSDPYTVDLASGVNATGPVMVKEILGASGDRKVTVVINSYETV